MDTETEYYVRQFLSSLYQLAVDSSQKVAFDFIEKCFPPEEVDRLRRTNDLNEIQKFLNTLVVFFREKKKEAKARGVKSFYGN